MNTIVAHELCHVRRRDNLLAFLHMVVETTVWFYPVVWWIGARLLEERERACDEDVLNRGAQPDVYADAILRVCNLYVESSRVCACGITGAILKRRIEIIMTNRAAKNLNCGRKFLLAGTAAAALVIPLIIGIIDGGVAKAAASPFIPESQLSSFELASVKPSTGPANDMRFCIGPCTFGERLSVSGSSVSIRYMSLSHLILAAWRIKPNQLSGPDWMQSQRFDIMAKIPEGASKDQLPEMLQTLLSDRFRLAVHGDHKEQPVFALVVDRKGLKLQKAVAVADTPIAESPRSQQIDSPDGEARRMENGDIVITNGAYGPIQGGRGGNGVMQWEFRRLSMPALAALLTPHVDRPVVDETKLTDSYRLIFENVQLTEGSLSRKMSGPSEVLGEAPAAARNDAFGEGLIRAIEKSGLRLEARKAPLDIIVVDHVEKSPTGN